VEFARQRVRRQRERLGESPDKIRAANGLLDPDVLTIGFARRFATYKRATLLFESKDRLQKLLHNHERPVQFIFAGKAHPKDEPGKRFIQEVYKWTRMPEFENRIAFIEDYDTHVGRRLTQGVDLWLNNPRRPLEASGTSGMKLPPNGGLNFSVLDGWWIEAYEENRKAGWPIGPELPRATEAPDQAMENEVDTASLFHILETQIIPLFYAKPDGRLPVAWIQLMRESIRSILPVFNTDRMVKEYATKLYSPAAKVHATLSADGGKSALALAKWKDEIRKSWPQIRIDDVKVENIEGGDIVVGDKVNVRATVHLGPINPDDVAVQAYSGEAINNSIVSPRIDPLKERKKVQAGVYEYRGVIPAGESGSYGLNVRVIPTHANLIQEHELRLITWAK
jgi:starch phosphorylase